MKTKLLIPILFLLISSVQAQIKIQKCKYSVDRKTNAFTDANMKFSNDGKLLIFGTLKGQIKIFDLSKNQIIKIFDAGKKMIIHVTFSPDDKIIASGNKKGFLKLWNLESGKEILSVEFSPDGSKIFTGSRDNYIKIWDAKTFKLIKTIGKVKSNIRTLQFSPDGKYIICGTSAILNGLFYYDAITGKKIKQINSNNTQNVSVVPDESVLATANLGEKIYLREIKSGKTVKELIGHKSHIHSVDFSPGGKNLLSGSTDSTAILWNIKTGKALYQFTGHKKSVKYVAAPKAIFVQQVLGTEQLKFGIYQI